MAGAIETTPHRAGVLLAFAAALALPGTARAQSFPADDAWTPATVTVEIRDSNTDVATTGGRNIVGDDPVNEPSVLVAGDATFRFFRLRLADAATSTNADWGCELDVDLDPSVYEYFVGFFNGQAPGTKVQSWFNGARTAGVNVTAATFKGTHSETVFKTDSVANTGPNTNHWISWAIPLSDLNVANFVVTAASPMRILCGVNGSGTAGLTTGASGDIAGATTFSDVLTCGDAGCSFATTMFGDGFEDPP